MRNVRLLIAVFAMFAMAAPAVAVAGDVVATVDGVDIRKGDIDWRMRNDDTLRFQPIDSAQARLEALRQLTVEIAAEHVMRGSLTAGSELATIVDQERRKRLLGIFEESSTAAISLAPGEVDRFIAANPQFFSKRQAWHYHEVVVTADRPDLLSILQSKAAAIGGMSEIGTAAMADAFDWARVNSFSTVMLNRWNGTEQIDPELMKVLEQMAATRRRVHVECRTNLCSFVVLHEVVADPVDPRFGRSSIEETLLAQKRARVASALHGGLLKRAAIEFRDPAVAKSAAKAWALPPFLKAGGINRAIWILQISLLLLSAAWTVWYLFKPQADPVEGNIRRKGFAQLNERLETWRFLRITQRATAVAVIVVIGAQVEWALAYTSFLEFDHDFAAVAGGSFLVLAVCYALWRFAPPMRQLAAQLRFAATGLLLACGLNAFITLALG